MVVKLPVLGAYSKTWPLGCEKSDRIVRDFAAYLKKPDSDKGFSGIGMLFLLSTGDDKDLPAVREWAYEQARKPAPTYAWFLGYGGIPLCEYYLRTGDKKVLPAIQAWANSAVRGQYLDAWAGRGGVPAVTYGNGHLNAAGTAVVTFLMLAKECGVRVPDHALLGCLRHFYRFAGRGNNPYGDHRPEYGFVDNGKNGNLAFAMAAAATLTPDGEDSLYAKARDVCAVTSFYTTSFMLHGHTGGGIGEIWRSDAMGLLYDKCPKKYREFMDNRKWHYELSRRWDGSFAILGGAGYDKTQWGAGYALTYTIPRKTLRISGAPPTKFSHQYQLPRQPWGNEADNAFLSLEAVPGKDGQKQDLSQETLAHDTSKAFLVRLHKSGPVSDDMLRQYIHHQDSNIRFVAANKVLGIDSGYIGWRSPGGEARPALMMEFLHDKSPCVRRAMFDAIAETMKREKPADLLTKDVFDLAVQAVENPAESWWVKDAALHVIGFGQADWVAPHVDVLLGYLKNKEWWLQNAALTALTPVVGDERCYRKVLPALGELLITNQRSALALGLPANLRTRIKEGGPAVEKLAAATLQGVYTGYKGVQTAEGGQDVSSTYDAHLAYIAASLADIPGGLDRLYTIARKRLPNQILPYKELFLGADPTQFGPTLKKAITPIIMNELIPEYVGKNHEKLLKLAADEVQSDQPGGPRDTIDGLTALYERAGHDDFGWHTFLDLRNAEWSYYTFDPIASEQVPWDQLITRYRKVTLPAGMEKWQSPDFDPAKAGWKRGHSPFGQYDGKIPEGAVSKCTDACVGPVCYGATKINTLWDKEVLLFRGTFKMPPLKKDCRYRLRVNTREHVGNCGGFGVYVNGKLLIEKPQCIGRGGGEKPYGAYITKEFLDDFDGKEVTIAVKSFLRFNDKYKVKPSTRVPQGRISVHLEEQKLPPMGDDLVIKSATVVPMLSSAWQAKQDPNDAELQTAGDKFAWDGKFVANPKVLGSWQAVTQVGAIDEFEPTAKKMNLRRVYIPAITLEDGGRVGGKLWVMVRRHADGPEQVPSPENGG